MGADVKQTGEQFEKSQSYLRWQDQAANQNSSPASIQAFSKEAADLLLELGIIKNIPDIDVASSIPSSSSEARTRGTDRGAARRS